MQLSFTISALLAATASAKSLSGVAGQMNALPTGAVNIQLWWGDKDVQDGEACGDANDGASCPSGSWCTVNICSSGKEGQTCAHGWGNADCNEGLSCVSNGRCARNAERGAPCGSSAGNVDCVSDYWCSQSSILGEQAQISAGDTQELHRCQDSFWKSGSLKYVAAGATVVAVAATAGTAGLFAATVAATETATYTTVGPLAAAVYVPLLGTGGAGALAVGGAGTAVATGGATIVKTIAGTGGLSN